MCCVRPFGPTKAPSETLAGALEIGRHFARRVQMMPVNKVGSSDRTRP
jgi:hypothetical protein